MRTTIPKTGNQSAHGSYGQSSHPPQVTGSRQNQPTAVKHGKRIGSWTSNECNSWLNGYLPPRPAHLYRSEIDNVVDDILKLLEYAKGFPQEHLMSAGQLLLIPNPLIDRVRTCNRLDSAN